MTEIRRYPRNVLLSGFSDFVRNPLRILAPAAELGPLVEVRIGPESLLLVNSPEGTRRVLSDASDVYLRESASSRVMREMIGDGILTSNGELWETQRQELLPSFRRESFEGLEEVFDAWVESEMQALRAGVAHAGGSAPVDLTARIRTWTLRVAADSLFGFETTEEEARWIAARVSEGQRTAMDRMLNPLYPPLWLPVGANLRARGLIRDLHAVGDRVLEAARGPRSPGTRCPYHRWIARDRANDRALASLRQQIMTVLMVGAENPGNTLSWTVGLLGRHPEVRAALAREVRGEAPDTGLLTRVLNETLRLYPGGWGLDRKASREDELLGARIRKGQLVMVSPYWLHRNPSIFRDPHRFDPDRFLPERARSIPAYGYLPFGGGPHQCLGKRYAFALMERWLRAFVGEFDIEDLDRPLPEAMALLTLRPAEAIVLGVRRASKGSHPRPPAATTSAT